MSKTFECFQWLSKTRNLSSLDLMAAMLSSSNETVRREAAVNLSARPEKQAKDVLIRSLGANYLSSTSNLKTIGYRLVPEVLDLLSDDRNSLFPDALKVVVTCEMMEALPRLVSTAERFGSPHGATASRLLLDLATRCGRQATETGQISDFRERLIQLLNRSLENFAIHRNPKIIDAFMACSIPDDGHIHNLLNDTNQKVFKLLARHWKTTECMEAVDLLVQALWKHYLSHDAQSILFRDRRDRLLAKSFAKCMRRELSEHVIERLQLYGTPACCTTIRPDDDELPVEDRLNLWRLLAITSGPLDWFLKGIEYFLSHHRERVEVLIADMLKLYIPPSHLEVMASIGMDDTAISGKPEEATFIDHSDGRSGRAPSPSTSAGSLASIRYLLQEYASFSPPLKDAVEYFLLDFHCANLIDKLNTKNDEYIEMFASIVVVGEPNWEESLRSCMLSPVPAVRCKATIAATYFPVSEKLRSTLRSLSEDPHVVIQEEAFFALERYASITKSDSSLPIISTVKLSDKQNLGEVAYAMG